ncbi:MAG: hypothetical protein L6R41_000097 [Letrouitia leprolyta]|nr:MAG: hypothetical protein L6R41_000097 [Letrouitia leprolyta]
MGLCTTVTPKWDTNGIWTFTYQTVTIPCPEISSIDYPVSRPVQATQGLLQGAPTLAASTPYHEGTNSKRSLALGLALGLGIPAILLVSFCIWKVRRSKSSAKTKPDDAGAAQNLPKVPLEPVPTHTNKRNDGNTARGQKNAKGAPHGGGGAVHDNGGIVAGEYTDQHNVGDSTHENGAHGVAAADGGTGPAQNDRGIVTGDHADRRNATGAADNTTIDTTVPNGDGAIQNTQEADTGNIAAQHKHENLANNGAVSNMAALIGGGPTDYMRRLWEDLIRPY